MNSNHITYLFGAGASAHSMPIVSEINSQIKALADELELSEWDNQYPTRFEESETNPFRLASFSKPGLIPRAKDVYKVINQHGKRFIQFETIDTYAKYLLLRGQDDQLAELKTIIDTYFAVRHFGGSYWNLAPTVIRSGRQVALAPYDSRYDSLMATIINRTKSGSLQLPGNLSFLSWNYDLEAELSYSKFFYDLKTEGLQRFRSLPNMIHINGNATMPGNGDLTWETYRKTLAENAGSTIGYAFDGYMAEDNALEFKSVLDKTTHLVIVGYSFPTFNRAIDRQILRSPKLRRVYIQDLTYEIGSSVKDKITHMRNHESDRFGNYAVKSENIIVLKDASQFFVPNELDDEGIKSYLPG